MEQGATQDLTYAFIVDENGFILKATINPENHENVVTDLNITDFDKPKWNGTEWVEGLTEEERAEREEQQLLESLKPSPSQIADAELEIKILTTLAELGVKQ